LNKIM